MNVEFKRAFINKLFEFNCQGILLEFGCGAFIETLTKWYKVYTITNDLTKIDKHINIKYIFAPVVKGAYDERLFKETPNFYDIILISNQIGAQSFFEYTQLFRDCVPIFFYLFKKEDLLLKIAKKVKKPLTIYTVEKEKFALI